MGITDDEALARSNQFIEGAGDLLQWQPADTTVVFELRVGANTPAGRPDAAGWLWATIAPGATAIPRDRWHATTVGGIDEIPLPDDFAKRIGNRLFQF